MDAVGLRGMPSGHTNRLKDEGDTFQTGLQHFEWAEPWQREGAGATGLSHRPTAMGLPIELQPGLPKVVGSLV